MLQITDTTMQGNVTASKVSVTMSVVPIEKSVCLEEQQNASSSSVAARMICEDTVEVSDVASRIQNSQNSMFVREFDCGSSGKVIIGWCENSGEVFAYAAKNRNTKEIKAENMPKDFSKIESGEVLEKFLANAYVRVTELSDGGWKLYIAQRGIGGMFSNWLRVSV